VKKSSGVILLFFGLLVTAATFQNCLGSDTNVGTLGQVRGTELGNPLIANNHIAELPRVYLNSKYPMLPSTSKTLTVGLNKNFQDCQPAIEAAEPGDVISIDAGFICSPISLPNKGDPNSTDFVVIQTANLNLLPPEGQRITETDHPNLAVIQTADKPAITTVSYAHHYYFVGIEIRLDPQYTGINRCLVNFNTWSDDVTHLAHDFVLARSYIHAGPQQEENIGVLLNAGRISIVDSVISEIHMIGGGGAGIMGFSLGAGPFNITNNLISSAGAAFHLGAKDSNLIDLIPSDVVFSQNILTKSLTWRQPITDLAGKVGHWGISGAINLESAQRILMTQNLIENYWIQDAEYNVSMIFFNPSSYNDGTAGSDHYWNRVQDVTFYNNVIRHGPSAMAISYQDPSDAQVIAQRLDIEYNTIYDIGSSWGKAEGLLYLSGQAQGPVEFNQNTMLDSDDTGPNLIWASTGGLYGQFIFTNNLTYDAIGGIIDPALGTGAPTLAQNFPGIIFKGNILAAQNAALYGSFAVGNYFPSDMASLGLIASPQNINAAPVSSIFFAPRSPFAGVLGFGFQPIGAPLNQSVGP